MKRAFLCYCLLASSLCLYAQEDNPAVWEFIESFVENLETEGSFDYDRLLEDLVYLSENPLDLNSDDLQLLVEFQFLTNIQLEALNRHKERNGDLLALEELQAIDLIDLTTIRLMLPFVTVKRDIQSFQEDLPTMLLSGDNTLFLRWARLLEEQKGFEEPDNPEASRFLGGRNKLYAQYRHQFENRLSFGITAETDPGEPFFEGINNNGFDFYSAHFFLRRYKTWLPHFALGDYTINLGQGLLLHSGFGVGKGAFATQIKKDGSRVRPYASVNESDFLRGAAATIKPTENIAVTAFVSANKVDANIVVDSLEAEDEIFTEFSSFQTSGLHRTPSEIADKDAITQRIYGMSTRYEKGPLDIAINAVHEALDAPFNAQEAVYNQFRFTGDALTNVSVDYSYAFRSLHFFGETAISDNGALATLNGLQIGLHKKADLAILSRQLPRNYEVLHGNTFGETSNGFNEKGIYIGAEIRPSLNWRISGYFDIWKHPWLRSNVDAPSSGNEQLVRVNYIRKRKFDLYFQYKREEKERNKRDNTSRTDFLAVRSTKKLRLHFGNKITRSFELRNRLEMVFFEEEERTSKGFMIYQDVLFKPIDFPLSFTGRIVFFDTDDSDSRIFAYENDLINNFSIPAYTHRGLRYYINLKYRGIRNLTAEFRLARTQLTNRDFVGSALNQIDENTRTDLKAQIKYSF